jgi:hypothetical protein
VSPIAPVNVKKDLQVRMTCTAVTVGDTGSPATKCEEHVTLTPTQASPRVPASSAPTGSPAGSLTLTITDPAAWGVAKVGSVYVVHLTEELAR